MRRERKAQAAELVLEQGTSPQRAHLAPEHHVRTLRVLVEQHAAQPRHGLAQQFAEPLLAAQRRGVCHEAHHHLAGRKALAQIEVAQRAPARPLIVNGLVRLRLPAAHGLHGLRESGGLEQAVLTRDDAVAVARVKSEHEAARFVEPDGELRLVAVAVRVSRAEDRPHGQIRKPANAREGIAHALFLRALLRLIGNVAEHTAAARPRDGAVLRHAVG